MTLGTGTESSLLTEIAFWVIAVSSIVAAIAVVQLRDLFRAALFLVVSFLGVAGMFVLLRAEFLAVVQILIYVGAISVLIVFAIVMTKDVNQGSPPNRLQLPALVLAALFFAAAAFVALETDWNLTGSVVEAAAVSAGTAEVAEQLQAVDASDLYSGSVSSIGELLVRNFVLAFEVASVLLLAAVLGALALIRER